MQKGMMSTLNNTNVHAKIANFPYSLNGFPLLLSKSKMKLRDTQKIVKVRHDDTTDGRGQTLFKSSTRPLKFLTIAYCTLTRKRTKSFWLAASASCGNDGMLLMVSPFFTSCKWNVSQLIDNS